jgi:hypothetical protein
VNEHRILIYLSVCLLIGIGVILATLYWHKRHLNRISQQIADLPPAPEGTERILTAIEGARMQISSTGDELRGQHGIIKERIQWLIKVIDVLTDRLRLLPSQIAALFTPKEPPK